MMKSRVFSRPVYRGVENGVVELLNSSRDIVSDRSLSSPRAVGDAIQSLLEEEFSSLLPVSLVRDYESRFAKRSFADFAFEDVDGNYYVVDCKTHSLTASFSMPNLTSVERLSRFYEDDSNYFAILLIDYTARPQGLDIAKCRFVPIEHLSWDCLTIGALGWGQIQIANSNKVDIDRKKSRRTWMLELCDTLEIFYPKEISKIQSRIEYFDRVRRYWESKSD